MKLKPLGAYGAERGDGRSLVVAGAPGHAGLDASAKIDGGMSAEHVTLAVHAKGVVDVTTFVAVRLPGAGLGTETRAVGAGTKVSEVAGHRDLLCCPYLV